jgi:hypothetical protein
MRRITYGLVGGLLLAAAVPATAFAAEEEIPVDSGNTAWLLISTALVMIMLPGLGALLRWARPAQERPVHDHAQLLRAGAS